MTFLPQITLERRDPALNMARFYTVRVERTLFGGWAVIRQWGRIGTAGQTREEWFEDSESAIACRLKLERAKRGRGYGASGAPEGAALKLDDVYTIV